MDLNLLMFRMGVMIVINTKTENGFLRRILTLELKIQHPKKTTQKKRKDSLENKMLHLKFSDKIEVGCDEAGRGCLAGPVIAAAVLLPDNFSNLILNDSKKLKKEEREELEIIIKKESISYGIGIVTAKEIDEINILKATFLAMHRAIDEIKTEYQLLLIDGNRFNPYKNITHECIIKGDGKFLSIAAASVLAKTERDRIMKNISKEFPQYAWERNKGYPTKQHREAIRKYGANKYHRKSFQLLPNQLKLF